jgi:glycosyltransferase involved in cell wall biosynthesis
MKILMVLDEEFPPDYRVEKEAESLMESGHEIILLCYTTTKDRPTKEYHKGIQIRRFYIQKNVRNKLSALYLVLPFYRWIWLTRVRKLVKEEKPDAIHIHDLPLCDIGLNMKKKFGLKLICDQHEYYSNWIVQNAHYNTFIGRIVKALSNWKKYEKKMLQQADLVITVEEPLRQEYIANVGIDTDRIITLPNTPKKSFSESAIDSSLQEKYNQHFVLFYLGGIDILRGIDTAIQAVPEIIEEIPDLKVVLAGKVWKNIDPIQIAEGLGVGEYVEFVGWVPVNKLPSYIEASDVCFHIPPVMREENNKTIATKIYQYMMIGKPIIIGQAAMMKELILDNEAGLDIRESNSKDFADRVKQLYYDKKLYERLASNSKEAGKRFVWEKTVKPLIDYYEKLN